MRVVATRFVNTLTQQPVALEFLPVGAITGMQIPGMNVRRRLAADTAESLFEPSADLIGYLLGHYSTSSCTSCCSTPRRASRARAWCR